MRRRGALTGMAMLSATGLPIFPLAQTLEKVRRIGVLMGYVESDTEAQSRLAMFKKTLSARCLVRAETLPDSSTLSPHWQKNGWRCCGRSRRR